jgi:nitroimidazol reductase NimA-like FMN-containing flavoprotein (pyridoxamine 5'-phosphate oxidase superfamily)
MSRPRARVLSDEEVAELLSLDISAHLATLDEDGFPRITPIWFLWQDGTFYMTSVEGARQLRDLARDPRACLGIDAEERTTASGIRRHRRLMGRGRAGISNDKDGEWTRLITLK